MREFDDRTGTGKSCAPWRPDGSNVCVCVCVNSCAIERVHGIYAHKNIYIIVTTWIDIVYVIKSNVSAQTHKTGRAHVRICLAVVCLCVCVFAWGLTRIVPG